MFDLEALAALVNLQHLTMNCWVLKDLAPLEDLVNLQSFFTCGAYMVRDWEPLGACRSSKWCVIGSPLEPADHRNGRVLGV
jgi:hypothetical protein